jgi:bacterioferritin
MDGVIDGAPGRTNVKAPSMSQFARLAGDIAGVDAPCPTDPSPADRSVETPLQVQARNDLAALLKESLATELVRLARFEREPNIAQGIFAARSAGRRFVLTAQELIHAARMIERIVQLGGIPDIPPECLNQRIRSVDAGAAFLRGFVNAQLLTVRVNIEIFGKIQVLFNDPTSPIASVLEGSIADARDHVKALERCLAGQRHPAPPLRPSADGDEDASGARAGSPADGPRHDRHPLRRVIVPVPGRRFRRS